MTPAFVCYLIAFVLFVLAAFGVPSRVNLAAAGWALIALGFLIGR